MWPPFHAIFLEKNILYASWFVFQLWVALNDARGPDKEFTNRPAVGYSTMLVFFNALITVAFYGWTLQV